MRRSQARPERKKGLSSIARRFCREVSLAAKGDMECLLRDASPVLCELEFFAREFRKALAEDKVAGRAGRKGKAVKMIFDKTEVEAIVRQHVIEYWDIDEDAMGEVRVRYSDGADAENVQVSVEVKVAKEGDGPYRK